MKRSYVILAIAVVILSAIAGGCFCNADRVTKHTSSTPKTIRDLIWIWGNPGMAEPGSHTFATYAQASPAQRAEMLHVPNMIMAGNGLPHDDRKAEELTESVAHCPRLIWEIAADG